MILMVSLFMLFLNMRFFSFAIVVILTMTILSCNRKAAALSLDPGVLEILNDFGFVKADNLSEVVDFALSQKKLIFLDVYTEWCLPCKMMDEDVFPDRSLGEFYSEHFISYKVDAETEGGADLAELFEVPSFPTLLFLDNRGRVLVKKIGMAYQDEMYDLADSAIAKSKIPTDQ